MKKNVFPTLAVMFIAALFMACSGPKDPTFEKFENIVVKSITRNKVTLNADLILNNPNPFSCNLKDLQMEIFSDQDIKLTEISQTFNTEMVANSNFKLPVQISFDPEKLLDEKKGLLTSVISLLNEKEVTLNYKGVCKVEVVDIAIEVPIDFEETTLLKK